MELKKSKRRNRIDNEIKYQSIELKREKTVGVELFNQLVRINDKVKNNQAYKHALYYMIVDRDFVDKEGHVLIPDYKIAVWCGGEGIKQYIAGKFNALDFLKAFKHDVLCKLEWSEPVWVDENHKEGKCRHIINETIADLVDSHLLNFDTERYSMVAGTKYNIEAARKRHAELMDEHNALVWPYPTVQAGIAQYLHNRSFSLFTRQITGERVKAARECIRTNPYMSSEAKRKELKTLHCIADMPKPFYKPAKSKLNARLFTHPSLCTIYRQARRILCEGWHEIDLKACYPSIAARIWDISKIQDMLDNKIDVWDMIGRELSISDEHRELTRDAVKMVGCRLLCGGQVDTSRKALNLALADLGIGIFTSPIEHSSTLMAIIDAVKKESIRAKQRGYTDTPLGKIELPNRKAETVRSHLAHVLSSYELALIAPCFSVAKEATDFTITMLQHDGFTVRLDKGEDRLQQVVDRLNREVVDIANKYGIDTHLTCKS